jgi:cytochrome P450
MTSSAPVQVNYPSMEGAECPWPVFEYLRREAPVYQIPDRPNLYIVTRYDDVKAIFLNTEVFSSHNSRDGLLGFDILLSTASSGGHGMIQTDPPAHKPKRDLGFAALKPARLKIYEPWIHEIAGDLIDKFIDEGRCEFVSEFATALPTILTLRLMGVPEEDMPWVQLWATFEASGASWMPKEFLERQRTNGAKMFEYLSARLQERYEQPRDDFMSAVIRAQIDRDGEFDLAEVRAQVAILLGGGVVTTAHFLSSLLLLLLQNPEQMAKVREDQKLIVRMIEEGVRLEPPAVWQPRRVTIDTELDGVRIPAGSFVLLMQGAANRDESKFDCPAKFDVTRDNADQHLSFGQGPHRCLGAPLARMEVRIAFQHLLTRLHNIRLAPGNDLTHIPSPSFRGLKRLEIEFERAPV